MNAETLAPKRNLLLKIAFEGTRYHGFQVQKNAVSVAQVFQDAVEKVLGVREDIKPCSRTDTGVHANEFCVGVRTHCAIAPNNLVRALNTKLPDDIAVLNCTEVPPDFHARYSAIGKEYIYRFYCGKTRNPFFHNRAYYYPYPLDADKMNKAASHFLGTHDFKGFCSVKCLLEDTVRTVTCSQIECVGEEVIYRVQANGFLYHMVRILAGTLVAVNRGRITLDEMPQLLLSKERARAGETLPAHGLYLNRVFYPDPLL